MRGGGPLGALFPSFPLSCAIINAEPDRANAITPKAVFRILISLCVVSSKRALASGALVDCIPLEGGWGGPPGPQPAPWPAPRGEGVPRRPRGPPHTHR